MFESDADRRAMIAALGGRSLSGPRGTFVGLFENEFVQLGAIPLDDSSPRLTAVTTDLEKAGVTRGIVLTIAGEAYTVRSEQPDGTGITVLVLEGP